MFDALQGSSGAKLVWHDKFREVFTIFYHQNGSAWFQKKIAQIFIKKILLVGLRDRYGLCLGQIIGRF